MKAQINKIIDHGHNDERILIKILEDSDIGEFLVLDTTYSSNGTVSNKVRHPFWFPDQKVKKGDWVTLYTKEGSSRSLKNPDGTIHYLFYWGLKSNVWNNDGDCALLLHVDEWKHHKVTIEK
ncbi:hypothetical protein [Flavobacterium chungangense]|uniref:Uncharacterized protein n=1 Tax=Flavobacterium chungangense TaxID=554283 RepID=A0A6V6YZ28_9FLAO|nr:hypothetical protein [Flavobacterium chungangense]CAD0004787.1 hypothetical protein FLACHUCJ7_02006 [Flavobacterium chungangense]